MFICQYDKWAKQIDATADHSWTEFQMQAQKANSAKLLTAMETLQGFEENEPRKDRIASPYPCVAE
jgi:hypothetical protein